ncbi:MAG: hypothetical protein NTY74_13605 [Ignavibacteriae bacterium]|nr:hypothetical protein [Ignavibacteriota bacterium]
MSKPAKDVKFIIYQVLYIFVIVVLTMKGADLDLTKVLASDKAVPKTYSDSLKAYIDSLESMGLVPRVEFDAIRNLDYKMQPIVDIRGMVRLTDGQVIMNKSDIQKTESNEPIPVPKEERQFELKIVQPTQFTNNTIKNNNSEPLQIYADNNLIQTIPANSPGAYQLKGQSTVKYVCGNSSKSVETLQNQTQKLNFQSFGAGNSEASLRSLQSVIGWRVTIDDDFIDQIDVKISGSVKSKQVAKGIYDIQLALCNSKDQFDRMFDNKEAPYSVSFNVVTTDKISGKVVSQQRTFTFGGW